MKKTTLTLMTIFTTFFAVAQWNNNGNNLTTFDNVGIGTLNPNTPLDIKKIIANGDFMTLGFDEINPKRITFGVKSYNGVVKLYDSGSNERISISAENGGYVGIGTSNPDERLTVKGKIHTEEVRVDLNVPADYVFQKYYTGNSTLKETYKMLTLEEVEVFTKKNHHLPEIPSAKEIQEKGLHLKEMTNLLLQKIEELTLYTIEQEKRIKVLEKKIEYKK